MHVTVSIDESLGRIVAEQIERATPAIADAVAARTAPPPEPPPLASEPSPPAQLTIQEAAEIASRHTMTSGTALRTVACPPQTMV